MQMKFRQVSGIFKCEVDICLVFEYESLPQLGLKIKQNTRCENKFKIFAGKKINFIMENNRLQYCTPLPITLSRIFDRSIKRRNFP